VANEERETPSKEQRSTGITLFFLIVVSLFLKKQKREPFIISIF
jgi:hypothetical protein